MNSVCRRFLCKGGNFLKKTEFLSWIQFAAPPAGAAFLLQQSANSAKLDYRNFTVL